MEIDSTNLPVWLKGLVYCSLGLAAFMSIWKNLNGNRIIHGIAKEFQQDGGTSLKDYVIKAARDSRKALRLSRAISRRQKEYISRVERVERGQELLEKKHDRLETRFARYVVHSANNTLQSSQLVDEEKRYLQEQEEAERASEREEEKQ